MKRKLAALIAIMLSFNGCVKNEGYAVIQTSAETASSIGQIIKEQSAPLSRKKPI